MKHRRGLPALVLSALFTVSLFSGTALASNVQSRSEAAAIGLPAASAPVVQTPGVYYYRGSQISVKTVIKRQLSCLQTAANFRCYDSDSELQRATVGYGFTKPGTNAKMNLGLSGATASGGGQCGGGVALLFNYQNLNYDGISSSLSARGAWYDFREEMNNVTTSFLIGETGAHMSEWLGGNGYWYPGPTGTCAIENNINTSNWPNWDNRISSRYRNP